MVPEENEVRIGVIGLGFVGLVTAAILAEKGNEITCIDTDREKIKRLMKNDLYIYEPGLENIFKKNRNRMTFTTDSGLLKGNSLAFICVPTPTVNDRIDLSYVESAIVAANSSDRDVIIAIKSTVVPGTASHFSKMIKKDIVSNPEFLREGNAIADTLSPDRIVIGGRNKEYLDLAEEIWKFTGAPVVRITNENAELIKYASNAFLATKISFINEIANLCEKIPGTDVNVVAEGMGLDKRIGREFLRAGLGFGGSCFPKDTMALVGFAMEKGLDMKIVRSAIEVNEERVEHAVHLIEKELGSFKGKKVCVLGISFKDNTNDTRESKSLELIRQLEKKGAEVIAFDPVISNVEGVKVTKSLEDCSMADCIVIASEWKEFRSHPLYDRGKNVIDLRRIADLKMHPEIKGIGVGYE
ncbi:MAG: UDP-glucose/GDP-mannose dehydrogenase family protein [Candidatus Thermoplasmatota archaeon]|jgi:UDPglucose 6-dehydrogenase|nr:UDP-glucose/GDP-mannose dehydrogenase family protein [Candidatus Thermoplasmatota archaeon]MCL5789179.1 UDP-glucose/GDP-mannose dehydrogenase family protein [Candidatus Thermoplasmatota archaeon]